MSLSYPHKSKSCSASCRVMRNAFWSSEATVKRRSCYICLLFWYDWETRCLNVLFEMKAIWTVTKYQRQHLEISITAIYKRKKKWNSVGTIRSNYAVSCVFEQMHIKWTPSFSFLIVQGIVLHTWLILGVFFILSQWCLWAARSTPQRTALMLSLKSTVGVITRPPTARGLSSSLTSLGKTLKRLLTGENAGFFFSFF